MNLTQLRFRKILKLLGGSGLIFALLTHVAAQTTPVIESGDDYTLAIDENGNLYSFGNNDSGQLGVPAAGGSSTAALLVEPAGGWTDVAVSRGGTVEHVLAIRNGNVYAWGNNSRGQLGNATTTNSDVPVLVLPASGGEEWVEVACGSNFSMALKSNGELWVWGDNSRGQLGSDPNPRDTSDPRFGTQAPGENLETSPVLFAGSSDTYTSIAAGLYNALAVRSDGSLFSWGFSSTKQLGLGFNPTAVIWVPEKVGNKENWFKVYSSATMCFAIRQGSSYTGKLFSWGSGAGQQSGRGDSADEPTRVGSDSDWIDVAIGHNHALGLKEDGSLYGWGLNLVGQLGLPRTKPDGSDIPENRRWDAPRLLTDTQTFSAIGAGTEFSVVYTTDGNLLSAGINGVGQLGNGTTSATGAKFGFEPSSLGLIDLRVDSVTVTSPNYLPGGSLSANVFLSNAGTGLLEDDFELSAVLSITPNFDAAGATPLTITSGSLVTTDIPAGGSESVAITVDLPASIDVGSYYLVIRADEAGVLSEITTDNNDGFDEVLLVFQADLQVLSSDVVLVSQTTEEIVVEVTVSNEGNGDVPEGAAGEFTFRHVVSLVADITDSSVIDLVTTDGEKPTVDTGLAVGASEVFNYTFELPDALGVGSYYIGVQVDDGEAIDESDEDNNVAFTATPELVVAGVDLAEALDNFDLDFQTVGAGQWFGSNNLAVIGGAVDDDAAVSPPISAGEFAYISTAFENASLVSFRWRSKTASVNNKLTFSLLGAEVGSGDTEVFGDTEWTTVVHAVPAGVQALWTYTEIDESNTDEVYLDDIQVAGLTLPDFLIDNVELTSGGVTVDSGRYVLRSDRLDLAIQVRNQGLTHPDSGADFDVRVYLSLDSTFDPIIDRLVYTANYASGLEQGETSLLFPSIGLPEDLNDGNYYVMVVVDEDNNVDELTLSGDDTGSGASVQPNNLLFTETASVEIVGLPDITIPEDGVRPDVRTSDVPDDDSNIFIIGDNLDFEITLENVGLAPVIGPMKVRVVLSSDSILDGNDYVVGEFTYNGGLAEEGTVGSSNTFRPDEAIVRADIPFGDFLYFGVIVDFDDNFEELNENNNAAFFENPYFIFQQVPLDVAMELDELNLAASTPDQVPFDGDKPFIGQTVTTFDGTDAAQSSDVEEGETAVFSTTFTTGSPTVLSFNWKCSTELTILQSGLIKEDRFVVYVDDVEVGFISGEVDWTEFRYAVDAGTHSIRWSYEKDGSVSGGLDTVWVDNFQYKQPDLTVVDLSVAQTTVSPGDILSFTYRVTNVGDDPVPATPSFTSAILLSQNTIWGDTGDVELLSTVSLRSSEVIEEGASVDFVVQAEIPPSFAQTGDYFVAVRVDPDSDAANLPINGPGIIPEADDTNNTTFTTIPVVTVIPPIDLNEAVDQPLSQVLTTGGAGNWFGLDELEAKDLPDGTVVGPGTYDVAQSGPIAQFEESYFETEIAGPAVLKFRWKTESAPFSNFLEVSVDGVVEELISGYVDWDLGYGPFTLEYLGDTTQAIRANATAQEVQDALNLLGTIIDAGGVTVAYNPPTDNTEPFEYVISFIEDGNQSLIAFTSLDNNRILSSNLSTNLPGGQNGSSTREEIQVLQIQPNVYFTLEYGGLTSAPIPYYSDASEVEAVLNAMPSIAGDGGVIVDDHTSPNGPLDFVVEFNVAGERDLIAVNTTNLWQPVTVEADLNADRFSAGGKEGQLGSTSAVQIQPLRIGPEVTVFVPAGAGDQRVRWTYRKSGTAGEFPDFAQVDQIEILPLPVDVTDLILSDIEYEAGEYILDVIGLRGPGTEYLDLTVSAKNQGNDIGATNFSVADIETRLSLDRVWGNQDDVVLSSFTQVEGDLTAAQLMRLLGPIQLGDFVPAGDYYLMAKVDSNDRVEEYDEANNIFITENNDVTVVRLPALRIYNPDSLLVDETLDVSDSDYFIDLSANGETVLDFDAYKIYYPESPMRMQFTIQNLGLGDILASEEWRVQVNLVGDNRDTIIAFDDAAADLRFLFDTNTTRTFDLGSFTVREAMAGRSESNPTGDRVDIDLELALPDQSVIEGALPGSARIDEYFWIIEIILDSDSEVEQSEIINEERGIVAPPRSPWRFADVSDFATPENVFDDFTDFTIPLEYTELGLFDIFYEPLVYDRTLWETSYGFSTADPDNLISYAFVRDPLTGDTLGLTFPGTYGIDSLLLDPDLGTEDYMTVTFDIVSRADDLTYLVTATDTLVGPAISELTIAPPFNQLVGAASLTGDGGLIDQAGSDIVNGLSPDDPGFEGIRVVSVLDQGYSSRVTLAFPKPVIDSATGFMTITVDAEEVDVPNPTDP